MVTQEQSLQALLVAVSFRSAAVVRALVESLSRLEESPALKVLVVDNASGQETIEAIASAIAGTANVDLVPSPTNLGYLGAAKFGLGRYLAQGQTLPDWVIVSNPDIIIEDRQFLEKLGRLDPSSAGVIAPRIVVPALNLNQNPFMRERPGKLKRWTMRVHAHDYFVSVVWDWLSRAKRGLRSRLARKRPEVSAAGPIYAPHGSFMIFSRKYFEAGGYLDDQLFLYGEEIAVGELCRELGLPVIYDPTLSVIHNEHQSVGVGVTRTKFNHYRQSMRHLFSRYLTP